MKLVLAEKPSVAQSIAKVLGASKREEGYLEGNGYIVSWCVGHLVELAQPEAYDARYSSIESIGTAVVVCCNDCLYPWKFDHQHFLLCDRSVAPGDCRLLHLLHRKGTVDFPGYPCRYGISGDPYNLPVGMGGCKT